MPRRRPPPDGRRLAAACRIRIVAQALFSGSSEPFSFGASPTVRIFCRWSLRSPIVGPEVPDVDRVTDVDEPDVEMLGQLVANLLTTGRT
jgi:hypothetical protein